MQPCLEFETSLTASSGLFFLVLLLAAEFRVDEVPGSKLMLTTRPKFNEELAAGPDAREALAGVRPLAECEAPQLPLLRLEGLEAPAALALSGSKCSLQNHLSSPSNALLTALLVAMAAASATASLTSPGTSASLACLRAIAAATLAALVAWFSRHSSLIRPSWFDSAIVEFGGW